MKKLLLWIVIVGLLALPATACTSPASTPASSSTPSSSASPSSASPSSSSSPKPAGPTQVRFDEVWPPQIDPALGQDAASSDVYANVYDSLVFPNADGTLRSALAEKWDVSTDGLTYTFHLRQGVKFHNGDPLTADDVVFSAERLMKIGQGYAYLFLPIVDKVTADGAATVKITLKNAFGPFLNALVNLYVVNKKQVMANLVTPGDYGDMGDYGKKWLLTHDAGSGPYQVTEMKLEEHLVAEKFAGYWSPLDPKVPDSFTLIGTEEPVTIRTLMSNRQLEISDQWQSEENYQAMLKIDGVQLAQFLSGSLLSIQLHNRKAPTDDVHVRKALAYAMDYASLIAGVYQGSKQATGPSSALLPGHKADVFQYTTNLDKAQEEIKQSKYYGQLDQYPIDVCYAAEWTTADKIALLFQASAAKIGVKVNIAKQPWAKMVADVAKPETTAQANILTVSPHYGEAGSPLSRYLSSNCGTWEQCEWLQDPEIDQMINDALGTVDQTQRFQKYAAIQDKLVDICPSIWLVDVMEKHAYQAGYVDWGTANRTQAGGNAIPVQGYNLYLPDIKIDPAKMP